MALMVVLLLTGIEVLYCWVVPVGGEVGVEPSVV